MSTKRPPQGIKQDEHGQFYMVGSNGARVLCNPPVALRITPRFKTLYDPEGREYIGGLAASSPEQRARLERFDTATGEWKRI